jgi:NADH dehydrogenase
VFVSSLGADVGSSEYQRSKLDAETLVRSSSVAWTIVRAGTVYGPGDEVVSTILKMVRTLPVVPVIDDGNQEFQPIWTDDLAKVLAAAIERDDVRGRILEAAGSDTTTMNDLLERFAKITDRKFLRVPVPMTLAQLTTKLASMAADIPIDEQKLKMLEEKNVVRGGAALDILGVTATPLERGLRILADAMPEVLPEEGYGSMEHKRVWADIRGTRHTPASLLAIFRERTNEIMPIEFAAEPGAPEQVAEGATMTGSLPLRGNIQIRVELDEPARIVFGTLEGHPLAGTVEFTTTEVGGGVRFAIDTWTRASNFLDWLGMNTLGRPAQSANWRAVVQRMIDASGGTSDGVHQEVEKLDEEERLRVEKRVRELVQARKREETSASPEQTPQR